MSDPLLYIAVSHHGFGHIAQASVVTRALARQRPLRLLLHSAAAPDVLARNFPQPFEHIAAATEPGMLMANALDVRRADSHAVYQQWVKDWPRLIEEEAARLRRIRPDLVLANVSPLLCAAAAHAGIPVIALCSLNWADVYWHYCQDLPGAEAVRDRLLEGYAQATAFLRPEPAMPMPTLDNTRAIGPLGRQGQPRRAELVERLGWSADERIVLVSLGGLPMELPLAEWPVQPGLRWLVPDTVAVDDRPDMVHYNATGMSYLDALASVDALVTKPGYGAFSEAGCNGVPTLYVRRRDWPEEPYLIDWLHSHGRAQELERERLLSGDLAEPLESLWERSAPPPPAPTGVMQAAALLASKLGSAE